MARSPYAMTALVTATLLLSACAPAPAAAPTASTAPTTNTAPSGDSSEMIMVYVGNSHSRPSTIPLQPGQQAMFMVINHSPTAAQMQTTLPMNDVQIDNPYTASPGYIPKTVVSLHGLDITVPAGQEVDVLFVPAASGAYPIRSGSQILGDVTIP